MDVLWSRTDCVLRNVQNTHFFDDVFIMVFTFHISSLLHSCRIKKPLQRKAHNRFESIACVYETQDYLLFILRENKVWFIHWNTNAHTHRHQLLLEQSISRLWLWQCSILFTGRLLHLTFIVAPGLWTSCKRHRSIQCLGPGASRLVVITSLFTLR